MDDAILAQGPFGLKPRWHQPWPQPYEGEISEATAFRGQSPPGERISGLLPPPNRPPATGQRRPRQDSAPGVHITALELPFAACLKNLARGGRLNFDLGGQGS